MTPVQEAARARRQKIIDMGPDLPIRQEVADAIGSTLKTVTSDILILLRQKHIRSVKTAPKILMTPELEASIRADYLAGEFRDDIAVKYGMYPERVSKICRGLTSPKVSCHRTFDANPGVTTRSPALISTTYSEKSERAKAFQIARRAAAAKYIAAYRARTAA